MTETNSEQSVSRRSVLKRSAGALAVGGGGLAAADAVAARRQEERSEERDGEVHEGIVCGDGHPEDSTFTVGRRCEDDCEVIQLTGLSPACITEEEQLYVNLPATEPTVWMNPRNGEIPPGTYRVVRAERCEAAAGECDGDDLYRLEFRPTDD